MDKSDKGYVYWTKKVPVIETGFFQKLPNPWKDSPDPLGERSVRIPEFVIPFENTFPNFESLERQLILAKPRAVRLAENEGLKLFGKSSKEQDRAVVKKYWDLWGEISDPSINEDPSISEKFKKVQDQVLEKGKSSLSAKELEQYNDYKDPAKQTLLKEHNNAKAFLLKLDKENIENKLRIDDPREPSYKTG